jgi:mono/diheme cytochrome c family protein
VRVGWAIAAAVTIAFVAYLLLRPNGESGIPVDVAVPALSAVAEEGAVLFEANCARCHGRNAAGTDRGPPLVHVIYHPAHYADEAFFLAARFGIRAHHWRFGPMPPQPQIGDTDVEKIVRYVRELQRANGISG